MYICYGQSNTRIPMVATDYVYPEDLYKQAAARMFSGSRLSLEFDAGASCAIYNEHELLLACRVVCEHHNTRVNLFDDDGWLQETADIWEKALFSWEEDEAEAEAEAEVEAPPPEADMTPLLPCATPCRKPV